MNSITKNITVERSSIISIMEGVGSVQPVNSYTVKALVTGDVLSAPFSEGDMIEAGQPRRYKS